MRLNHHRRDFALSIAAGLLAGCSSSTPSHQTPQVSEQALSWPSPAWSIAAAPTMTPADGTPSVEPIDESVDGAGELDTLLGVVVVAVSDRLRVRSKPSVSDDSIKYEPPLPLGTSMHAFNGPVRASGYDWYEVALVSVGLSTPGSCGEGRCDLIYSGWVARQSRDGELWLAHGEADCPPVPNDVPAVVSVPLGVLLPEADHHQGSPDRVLLRCRWRWLRSGLVRCRRSTAVARGAFGDIPAGRLSGLADRRA